MEETHQVRVSKLQRLVGGHEGAWSLWGTRCVWGMAGLEHMCRKAAGWRGRRGQTFEDSLVNLSEPLGYSQHNFAQSSVFNVEFWALWRSSKGSQVLKK